MLDWLDVDFSSLKSLTFFDLTIGHEPLDEYEFYGAKDLFGEGKGAGGYWELACTNDIKISIGLLQGRISINFDKLSANAIWSYDPGFYHILSCGSCSNVPE